MAPKCISTRASLPNNPFKISFNQQKGISEQYTQRLTNKETNVNTFRSKDMNK